MHVYVRMLRVEFILNEAFYLLLSTENRHNFIKPESTGLHEALDKAEGLFKNGKIFIKC